MGMYIIAEPCIGMRLACVDVCPVDIHPRRTKNSRPRRCSHRPDVCIQCGNCGRPAGDCDFHRGNDSRSEALPQVNADWYKKKPKPVAGDRCRRLPRPVLV
jgi:ferredoxin